ncbi:MAG: hypothetical protein MMC33_006221 [Icmadophila ericetorum]|nr:hypothetical protein [Icmadophila ericetorum]
MEHRNRPLDRDETSPISNRGSPPSALNPRNLDFGGKPTKMNVLFYFIALRPQANMNALDLERVVRTMLQEKNGRVLMDNAHLSSILSCLRYKNRLTQLLKNFTNFAIKYVREHPWETTFALLSILSILIVPVILPAIGFSAIGPVASSLAAAWQASIGIVAAGTPFSILQGAAMGGAAASIFYGVGVAGLAGLAIKKAVGWVAIWWNGESDEAEETCPMQEIVQEFRERRSCEHKGRWRRIEGPHRCEECGYKLPQFILVSTLSISSVSTL